jgi:hypothetical protein
MRNRKEKLELLPINKMHLNGKGKEMLLSIFSLLFSGIYLVFVVANFSGSSLMWASFCISAIAFAVSGFALGVAYSTGNIKHARNG